MIVLKSSTAADTQDNDIPVPYEGQQRANMLLPQQLEVGCAARTDEDEGSVIDVQSRPYFWFELGLYNIFGVFEDAQDAFLSTIRQESRGQSFISREERPASCIIVPVRTYTVARLRGYPCRAFTSVPKMFSALRS